MRVEQREHPVVVAARRGLGRRRDGEHRIAQRALPCCLVSPRRLFEPVEHREVDPSPDPAAQLGFERQERGEARAQIRLGQPRAHRRDLGVVARAALRGLRSADLIDQVLDLCADAARLPAQLHRARRIAARQRAARLREQPLGIARAPALLDPAQHLAGDRAVRPASEQRPRGCLGRRIVLLGEAQQLLLGRPACIGAQPVCGLAEPDELRACRIALGQPCDEAVDVVAGLVLDRVLCERGPRVGDPRPGQAVQQPRHGSGVAEARGRHRQQASDLGICRDPRCQLALDAQRFLVQRKVIDQQLEQRARRRRIVRGMQRRTLEPLPCGVIVELVQGGAALRDQVQIGGCGGGGRRARRLVGGIGLAGVQQPPHPRARVVVELVDARMARVLAEVAVADRDDIAALGAHHEVVRKAADQQALEPGLELVAAALVRRSECAAGRVDLVDAVEQLPGAEPHAACEHVVGELFGVRRHPPPGHVRKLPEPAPLYKAHTTGAIPPRRPRSSWPRCGSKPGSSAGSTANTENRFGQSMPTAMPSSLAGMSCAAMPCTASTSTMSRNGVLAISLERARALGCAAIVGIVIVDAPCRTLPARADARRLSRAGSVSAPSLPRSNARALYRFLLWLLPHHDLHCPNITSSPEPGQMPVPINHHVRCDRGACRRM